MPNLKYCERCGIFMGAVVHNKRYCAECKRKAECERKKKSKEAHKVHVNYGVTSCEFCGKPMVKRSKTQKYHTECQKEAYALRQAEYKAVKNVKRRAKLEGYNKQKDPKKLSVADVSRMADKAGVSYGQMSLQMMQSKI